ncbi:hypothetical protein EDB19DRAFT_2020522 [Suillus lakei]|nr:hypothetical protein EDB19DRAFT_2020522 [Suillus lakei]
MSAIQHIAFLGSLILLQVRLRPNLSKVLYAISILVSLIGTGFFIGVNLPRNSNLYSNLYESSPQPSSWVHGAQTFVGEFFVAGFPMDADAEPSLLPGTESFATTNDRKDEEFLVMNPVFSKSLLPVPASTDSSSRCIAHSTHVEGSDWDTRQLEAVLNLMRRQQCTASFKLFASMTYAMMGGLKWRQIEVVRHESGGLSTTFGSQEDINFWEGRDFKGKEDETCDGRKLLMSTHTTFRFDAPLAVTVFFAKERSFFSCSIIGKYWYCQSSDDGQNKGRNALFVRM